MKKIITFLIAAFTPLLSMAKDAQLHHTLHSSGLQFIENKGQIMDQNQHPRKDIQFVLASKGMSVAIGNGQVHYQFNETADKKLNSYRTDVTLVGANTNAKIITAEPQDYFEKYNTGGLNGAVAHAYKKVTYKNIYYNIDWVLYIKDNKLEYDFVVRPGGKSSDIKMKYDGATALNINNDGALAVATPIGNINEQAPVSYAQATGRKVTSSFLLNGNVLSFHTAPCNGVLVIDPVLEWATYYGSELYADYIEGPEKVMTDGSGNVYLLATDAFGFGENITTSGAYQTTFSGGAFGVVLVKFNSAGQRLWATFYGGSGSTQDEGIVCDAMGNIYITGSTTSSDGIATANAFQTIYAGGFNTGDAFLTKFDSSGNLKWGTYYGGGYNEQGLSVACDASGNVYMGAYAEDGGLASAGSFQDTLTDMGEGSLLAKFDSSGNRIWATYYTGQLSSIACDAHGHVFITGFAYTNDTMGIATLGTYQGSWLGAGASAPAFLVKFDTAGNRIWGTYYGSPDADANGGASQGNAIAVDGFGNEYISGQTQSATDLASTNGYHTISGGGEDAFVAKFDSAGQLKWGTYYGGVGTDEANGVACDLLGNVYMAGTTGSQDEIATADGLDTSFNSGTNSGLNDAFLVKFDAAGNLLWGTYYGGTGDDYGTSVLCDNSGNVYLAGDATSTAVIATPNGFDTAYYNDGNEFQDPFLVKIKDCTPPPATFIASGTNTFCQGDSVMLMADTTTPSPLTYQWQNNGVNVTGATGSTYTAIGSGMYTLIQANVFTCADTSTTTDTVVVYPLPTPVITASVDTLSTGAFAGYQWLNGSDTISGATTQSYTVTVNGTFYVVVTDSNGCSKKSAAYVQTGLSISQISALAANINVYPNPATSIVYINAPVSVNVSVSSIDGRTMLQQNHAKNIDLSAFANGMYLLRIMETDGNLIKTDKIVKTTE